MDVPLTVTQAIEGRDAMAKDLYVNREEEEKRREPLCAMCGVLCVAYNVLCVVCDVCCDT